MPTGDQRSSSHFGSLVSLSRNDERRDEQRKRDICINSPTPDVINGQLRSTYAALGSEDSSSLSTDSLNKFFLKEEPHSPH